MDTKPFERIAMLSDQKKALEQRLKDINDEIRSIEDFAIPMALEEGIPSMTVKVGEDEYGSPIFKTVSLRRKLWAGKASVRVLTDEGLEVEQSIPDDEYFAALHEAGMGEYVEGKVNANRISAYIREFDDGRMSPEDLVKKLPEPLQRVIKISEVYKLVSVPSKR
jgi:hypothetical protein